MGKGKVIRILTKPFRAAASNFAHGIREEGKSIKRMFGVAPPRPLTERQKLVRDYKILDKAKRKKFGAMHHLDEHHNKDFVRWHRELRKIAAPREARAHRRAARVDRMKLIRERVKADRKATHRQEPKKTLVHFKRGIPKIDLASLRKLRSGDAH